MLHNLKTIKPTESIIYEPQHRWQTQIKRLSDYGHIIMFALLLVMT